MIAGTHGQSSGTRSRVNASRHDHILVFPFNKNSPYYIVKQWSIRKFAHQESKMSRFVVPLAMLLSGAVVMSAIAQPANKLAVSTAQGIRLDRSRPTRIPLTAAGSSGENLSFRIPPPGRNTQTYLVLQNIFAESQPGVGYDVYLDLPPGRAPPGRSDVHYVGTIHFFDTAPDHRREERLNITDSLKALAAEGQLSAPPSVTVVPAATAEGDSQIGSVAIEAE
jgi:hypothetical protein